MLAKVTHAIVARVPEIFDKQKNVSSPIDLALARSQHAALVSAVRGLGVDVLELPPDETSVESVYTEDLAVVVNGIALMCKPQPHRMAEVDAVRAVLKKELDQTVVDVKSPSAMLSGCDVLFTGKEFFVGISHSTNLEGAAAVANTWPEYPCTPINVGSALHLKSFVCMCGPDVLSVGSGPDAQSVLRRIERQATYRYATVTLPDDKAANVLFVNGHLVHRSADEAPKSDAVFCTKLDFPRIPAAISEFSKTTSPRTISSLFIMLRKSKHVKRL